MKVRVNLLGYYFWCIIVLRTYHPAPMNVSLILICFEVIAQWGLLLHHILRLFLLLLQLDCEAEVGNNQSKPFIDKKVFWFYIPVGHTPEMQVVETLHKLYIKGTSKALCKTICMLYEVVKLAILCQLHNIVANTAFSSYFFDKRVIWGLTF